MDDKMINVTSAWGMRGYEVNSVFASVNAPGWWHPDDPGVGAGIPETAFMAVSSGNYIVGAPRIRERIQQNFDNYRGKPYSPKRMRQLMQREDFTFVENRYGIDRTMTSSLDAWCSSVRWEISNNKADRTQNLKQYRREVTSVKLD